MTCRRMKPPASCLALSVLALVYACRWITPEDARFLHPSLLFSSSSSHVVVVLPLDCCCCCCFCFCCCPDWMNFFWDFRYHSHHSSSSSSESFSFSLGQDFGNQLSHRPHLSRDNCYSYYYDSQEPSSRMMTSYSVLQKLRKSGVDVLFLFLYASVCSIKCRERDRLKDSYKSVSLHLLDRVKKCSSSHLMEFARGGCSLNFCSSF